MHLTLNSGVTDLLKIDAHPASGGTALFRRPVLAEHFNLKRFGCEVPLPSGALERDLLFLR